MSSNQEFSTVQKQYLQGFFAGVSQRGQFFVGQTANGQYTNDPNSSAGGNMIEETVHGTPIDDLCKEEKIKYEQNGLDVWDKMLDNAAKNKFPEGGDVFRYKFHGLFFVTPAQESMMLRCRIPGCVLRSEQMIGLAEIAEDWGGGYAHITTRGNFQIREIMPKYSVDVLVKMREVGLTAQGSGADNVRNITASPTSGFDALELTDVLPLAKAMHHYILNNRDLYDLPRKFNIAFDNGGAISVCADTNDIAFYAVRVGEGQDVEPGVYFRVQLCGITGHKQFATDCGLLLKANECVAVAAAMLRVFQEHGDRTNRKKARLKYLVDKWGVEKYLEEVGKKLAFELRYFALQSCEPRHPITRHGYIGVYPQKQAGLNYVGITVPVGHMTPDQMKGTARLAAKYGKGEIRLTVWQNLIIPHIPTESLDAFTEELRAMGFDYTHDPITNGLVACTGSAGCKFAASATKAQSLLLGEHLRSTVNLDQPINIHLTGCPNSCAQHYVGDIGLQGVKVKVDGESVEGYHIVLGGGVDNEQGIGQEVFPSVPFADVPPLLERVLKTYMQSRVEDESFLEFTRRHTTEELKQIFTDHVLN
ncbi:NirA family protein [Cerasicoccus arenae]|uniref:Ferredoxin--nitrite reductase n=1 Tax=Cerasicoccus arenae TaxID=424488 RepID=A0A8J3DD99_9BACT|nr:NirA family protein [Cerasicoccus arenae]MBK1859721.1 NirA family protein [Cerasicoccus arenae]GHC05976.1 ferredoxin--nitrite reductase [Cerasicoccus arenae]